MHEWRDTKKTAQIQSIHIAPRRALQGSGRGKRFKKYVYVNVLGCMPPLISLSRDQWDGRSRTTFHGTQRACHVGEDPKHSSLLLCHKDDCCLCSILRKSFRVDKAGESYRFPLHHCAKSHMGQNQAPGVCSGLVYTAASIRLVSIILR